MHMSRNVNTPPKVDRAYIMRIAGIAEVDHRTVAKEIAAQAGKGKPVKGLAGDRIRRALEANKP